MYSLTLILFMKIFHIIEKKKPLHKQTIRKAIIKKDRMI